jgi:hypothetical protein
MKGNKMADIIRLAGTIQASKSMSVINLWTTNYNDKLQKDIKTLYKVWLAVPGDWTEGSWIEVEGSLSVRPSFLQDGTPRTYQDSKGNTITAHDLNVNDVNIIQVKLKEANAPEGVDLDDARKYGTAQNRDLMEQPF